MYRSSFFTAPILALVLAACPTRDNTGADSDSLAWYTTCGDPSCGGYTPSAHANAACTTEIVGDECTPEGAGCDLVDKCNTELVCACEDPKTGKGGCPISLRSAKTDIHYLGTTETRALHDELMRVRLAGYRYKIDPDNRGDRLGFIIDDQRPGTPIVMPNGSQVDLYGYASMAVAALQVQEDRLAEQQERIDEQDARIAALEARLAAMEPTAR